jgi:3-hydroxyisobutyrate dehydrogenase
MIGSRPQVRAGALVHLLAGEGDAVDRVDPVLAASAPTRHRLGPHPGSAATTKLIVNALLATQVAGLAELLHLARAADLDPGRTMEILAGLPVTSPAAARAGAVVLGGDFTPNFPVDLAAKDLRYLDATARAAGAAVPVARAVRARFDAARADGLGGLDLTAVARSVAALDGTGSPPP